MAGAPGTCAGRETGLRGPRIPRSHSPCSVHSPPSNADCPPHAQRVLAGGESAMSERDRRGPRPLSLHPSGDPNEHVNRHTADAWRGLWQ